MKLKDVFFETQNQNRN